MRMTVAVAMACLIGGISVASDAKASIKRFTNIPAQNLDAALHALAAERDIQIVYFSNSIGSLHTAGAVGELTTGEAFAKVLSGTNLTYRYLDDNTITILPISSAGPADSGSSGGKAAPDSASASETLYEVIVTANKRPEGILDVAGGVNVATAELLDKVSATKLTEYAAFVPGLQVQPSLNAGQQTIILRGIVPQQSSPTVSTYVDDVAVGGTSNQGNGVVSLADIDPAELERVEVLNGPQGTLYGASSLGGVVKFVTRKPNLRGFEGSVSAEGYSVAHGDIGTQLRARMSAPLIADTLAISLSGHHRKEPGFLDDVGLLGKDANDGETYGARASLLFQPSEDWEVRVNALFSKRQSDSTNAVIIDPDTRQPLYGEYGQRHAAPSQGSNELELYSATINRTFGEGGPTLTSATSYSKTTMEGVADAFNFFEALLGLPIPTALSEESFPVRQFTQEVRLASARNGELEWLIGGYYQREHGEPMSRYYGTNPDGSIRTLPAPFDPLYVVERNYRLRELAAFGNASYYFMPNLWVTLGYRYSDIEQHDKSARSGFLGNPANPSVTVLTDIRAQENKSTYLATLSYQPTLDTLLYARAASGYRPGGTRTRPPGAPADFKTSFESDSIWNYEIGAKHSWPAQRLNAGIAAFWIDWTDIQENFQVGDSNFNAPGNGGRARSRGVEMYVGGEPVHGLNLTASATYTDAEFLEENPANGILAGQRLPDVSRWSAGLATEYTWRIASSWSAIVGGDVQFKSKNINIERYSQDGYSLVGLHAGAERNGFRATLYVKNLFDQYRYLVALGPVAGNLLPFEAVISQPRTIGVSLSQEF